MKKTVLYIGLILILINSIIGSIIVSYDQVNIILVDVSLIFTTALIYETIGSEMVDGLRIGMSFFYVITGVIRAFISLFSNNDLKNNYLLIFLLLIFGIEIISLIVVKSLNKLKSKL